VFQGGNLCVRSLQPSAADVALRRRSGTCCELHVRKESRYCWYRNKHNFNTGPPYLIHLDTSGLGDQESICSFCLRPLIIIAFATSSLLFFFFLKNTPHVKDLCKSVSVWCFLHQHDGLENCDEQPHIHRRCFFKKTTWLDSQVTM